ncbi:MAG TPA: GNAT family N-acetyltransferase, partial [Roseiflexaceae bacterium]|nr:GNAT family N-acetyltransferase [Roseiflexaceae bacterium]
SDPRLDPARDLRMWEEDGVLIGFGQLWPLATSEELNGRLMLWVRPEMRGNGLEVQIIDWAGDLTRSLAREQGLPARLRYHIREDQAEWHTLLQSLGFEIDRYSYTMTRSLAEPIAAPHVPEGFVIREVAGTHEAQQWVEMFNQSFVDHPGSSVWKVEQALHFMEEPGYRQDLNTVAVAADGTFAGFCWATIYAEQNARSGHQVGEIDVLGTRRGFRNLGLGRALLIEGMRRLKAAGMETARLGVIADNPTGALKLYESAGFERLHTWVRYSRDV